MSALKTVVVETAAETICLTGAAKTPLPSRPPSALRSLPTPFMPLDTEERRAAHPCPPICAVAESNCFLDRFLLTPG